MADGADIHGEQFDGPARIVAGVTALIAWAGLALQLYVLIDALGAGPALWRFLGYFTLLANVGVAMVATAVAAGSSGPLAAPRARLLAASSIVLVGLVYSLALRATWDPQGHQKIVDFALHDATPLLFVIMWILAPNGALNRRDFGWALVPPALYAAYAMARGAIDGWYAYWFFDPRQQSVAEIATSVAILVSAMALIAAVLVAVDGWLGRIEAEAAEET